jgi:hypothetical protein
MKGKKVPAAASRGRLAWTSILLVSWLVGTALTFGATQATAAEVVFAEKADISTAADGAFSVYAADVDSDGDLDALSASFSDDKIAWYENTAGDGSAWRPRTISKAAGFAQSVFAADVDGDGHIDVLSASERGDRITWYENAAGDGSAWPSHDITASAKGARCVFAADMDGDGDIDALSASRDDDKIAWYENTQGNGSVWKEHVISTKADGAHAVFAADIDGDGDIDAVSASENDDKVAWYENRTGDGTTWKEWIITEKADSAHSVYAADIDGDGDLDVLSASYLDDTVAWHENLDGKGTTWKAHPISTSADAAMSVVAADIDGDGDLDVLSASANDDTVAWHENTAGNGSAWISRTISKAVDAPFSVYAADLDGDGDVDALSASFFDDTIAWYRNESRKASTASAPAETKSASP